MKRGLKMQLPMIKFDWEVNLGHLISIIVFVIGGLGAYYDLKSEVKDQRTYTEARFKEYDKIIKEQRDNDSAQDRRTEQITGEIKETIKDTKKEINENIRDLRTDIFRSSRR